MNRGRVAGDQFCQGVVDVVDVFLGCLAHWGVVYCSIVSDAAVFVYYVDVGGCDGAVGFGDGCGVIVEYGVGQVVGVGEGLVCSDGGVVCAVYCEPGDALVGVFLGEIGHCAVFVVVFYEGAVVVGPLKDDDLAVEIGELDRFGVLVCEGEGGSPCSGVCMLLLFGVVVRLGRFVPAGDEGDGD